MKHNQNYTATTVCDTHVLPMLLYSPSKQIKQNSSKSTCKTSFHKNKKKET